MLIHGILSQQLESDSIASFERTLDKFWNNLDVKFDPDAIHPFYHLFLDGLL